jgi:flagellar basal-body rod protein FlgB
MSGGGTGIIGALKTRMHWHQTRQKLLAENVANADTPRFKPHDLKPPAPSGTPAFTLTTTSPMHVAGNGLGSAFDTRNPRKFETTPNGNSVNLEEEMLKVSQNQGDFQLAASLYQKSFGLLKIAIGKGR